MAMGGPREARRRMRPASVLRAEVGVSETLPLVKWAAATTEPVGPKPARRKVTSFLIVFSTNLVSKIPVLSFEVTSASRLVAGRSRNSTRDSIGLSTSLWASDDTWSEPTTRTNSTNMVRSNEYTASSRSKGL